MDGPLRNEVRRLRRAQDVTQEDLASRVGISRTSLSAIEQGGDARLGTAMRLSRELGVDVETLFPAHAAQVDKEIGR